MVQFRLFLGILGFILVNTFNLSAQVLSQDLGQIHGNFQSDFQWYQKDSVIGVPEVKEKIGSNSLLQLNFTRGNLKAGVRFEAYQPVLLGYDSRWTGSGIANRFVEYKFNGIEVTAGNFYEQFGNGLLLRSYQSWSLGFDNSIDGFRVKSNIYKGINITALAGHQRYFFNKGAGTIRGADVDIQLNESIASLSMSPVKLSLGGSFVSKYQKDEDPILKLPENVAGGAVRTGIVYKDFSLASEYAYKINDPSFTNANIYKTGNAYLLNLSYTRSTIGFSLNLKRIDNMDFRSDRGESGNNLLINYLPPITPQLSYGLTTLYPYATQPLGEMGFQSEVSGRFVPESSLGGQYGTMYLLNYCHINDIHKKQTKNVLGYESDFTKAGDNVLYKSFQIEINKKLNKNAKVITSYFYIEANNKVLRIAEYDGTIYSNIGVIDFSYKLKPKHTLKTQVQWLKTAQDRGDWASLLLEYNISPMFFASINDDYNYGNKDETLAVHYINGNVGIIKGTTRFTIGYGRQRAGVVCVGGLCRLVPATNGLSVSLSSSF